MEKLTFKIGLREYLLTACIVILEDLNTPCLKENK